MISRWREGERGRTGDHGQTGSEGATGKTGESGLQGEIGPQGPRGTNVTLGQFLAFALIVGAGYLGFDALQKQQDAFCNYQRENREALRQVYRDVADLGRKAGMGSDRRSELDRAFNEFEANRLAQPRLRPIPDGCPE